MFPAHIKRVWDLKGFDLLRAHSVRYVGPAALLARRRYRLPVPVVTHHHHLDPSRLNPYIERRVLRASDCVITDSRFAKDQIHDELGISVDHVRVVYCGAGTKYRPQPKDRELIRRFGLDGKQVLLSMGPLIERKNPRFALELLRDLRLALGEGVVLMWVGAGPLRRPLERLARRLGVVDGMIFTGYLPEAEKVAVLNLADVFGRGLYVSNSPALSPAEKTLIAETLRAAFLT